MAGVSLTIDARLFKRHLMEAAARCRSLRPALRDAGEIMIRSKNETFRVGGRPQPWAPLSAATLARAALGGTKRGKSGRRSRFTKRGTLRVGAARGAAGKKILVGPTSNLQRSINYRVYAREVVIGTNVVYAATHQFGRGRIPARPFLVVQDADRVAIRKAFAEHISGVFR